MAALLVQANNHGTLDLEVVRDEARLAGLYEIYYNEQSRVVSFASTDDHSSPVRVNVYYTTGTVGTCLTHPRQGKTQLFRRNVDLSTLAELFREPRLHTGTGYHRSQRIRRETCSVCQDLEASVPLRCGHVPLCRGCADQLIQRSGGDSVKCPLCRVVAPLSRGDGPLDEEAELCAQAARLKAEAEEVDAMIAACVARREEVARREAERRRRREEAERLERQRQESQARARAAREAQARLLVQRRERGTKCDFYLSEAQFVSDNFSPEVTCIATNGDSTIMLYENGGWAFTGGIPKLLHNKLNGRARSLPSPTYVAIGSDDRYYIQFADGKSEWVGCENMGNEIKNCSALIKTVAFGESWGSYFLVSQDGDYSYCNIPSDLEEFVEKSGSLNCVSLGGDGAWYAEASDGRASWGAGFQDRATWEALNRIAQRLTFLDFGSFDGSRTEFFVRYE